VSVKHAAVIKTMYSGYTSMNIHSLNTRHRISVFNSTHSVCFYNCHLWQTTENIVC